MQRVFFFLLLFGTTLLFTARELPATPVWKGGFSLAASGYSSECDFARAEYVDLALFIDPWQTKFLSPSFHLDLSIPALPFSPDKTLLGTHIGVRLFVKEKHIFKALMTENHFFAPSLDAGLLFSPVADGGLKYRITIYPLKFYSGDGHYTFFAFSWITNTDFQYQGWGIKLFEFSLYLF